MNNANLPIKESTKLRLCGYCIKIKNRSKRFVSAYALTWHITHIHKDDIALVDISDVSIPKNSAIQREFRYDE